MPGRSRPLIAAAFALLTSFSAAAHADGPPGGAGADEVSLRNGGMVRGTIVTIEPDKQVTILLAPTNESRTIPWADISKVERGKYAPAPAPAPVIVNAPPPAEPIPVGPRLHIEADEPGVSLNRIRFTFGVMSYGSSAYGVASETVCRAPCDRVIDAREGHDFFFGGEGITPSRRFQLGDMSGDVTAQVSAGSAPRRIGGVALTLAGGGLTLAGAMTLGFSYAIKKASMDSAMMSGNPNAKSSFPTALPAVGGAILGVGAAMLITGIVFWATSGTSYTLQPRNGGPAVTGKRLRFSGGALLF